MKSGETPIANPFVVLREEFDDWAILFNPDTCRGFGLNPIGVYLWKLFDGKHSVDDLLMALRRDAENVPENVHDSVGAFLEALVAEGLTGFQCTEPEPCAGARGRRWLENCSAPVSEQSEAKPFTYEPPKLVDFTGGRAARGDCTDHGSQGGAMCVPGAGASSSCYTGACWCTKGEALGNDACCDGSGGAIGANFCWNGGSVAGDCIGGGNPYCGHCGTGCNQ